MTKLCLSVSACENILMEARAKHDTSDKYPKITTDVHKIITRDHLSSKKKLIEVLKPVVNLIGRNAL